MELKLVILSLACLSCVVPPSQGTSLLAAKAAAVGAAKGAAVLGAVKGAAVLGAGALAAKGLALKGAVVVGAKVAAAKALASKVAGLGAAVAVAKPTVQVPQTVILSPPSLSEIKDRVVGLISTVHAAALNKKAAVSQLLLSLLPSKTVVLPPKVVEVPKIVEVPTLVEVEKIVEIPKFVMPSPMVQDPAPCPPSVAVVGPTMNVVYDNPERRKLYPGALIKRL